MSSYCCACVELMSAAPNVDHPIDASGSKRPASMSWRMPRRAERVTVSSARPNKGVGSCSSVKLAHTGFTPRKPAPASRAGGCRALQVAGHSSSQGRAGGRGYRPPVRPDFAPHLQIGSVVDRPRRGSLVGGRVRGRPLHVAHRAAICRDERVRLVPFATDHVVQYETVGTRRLTVLCIVGAHDTRRLTLLEGDLVLREVRVEQIEGGDVVRVVATVGFRAVRCEVLEVGQHLRMARRVLLLHTPHHVRGIPPATQQGRRHITAGGREMTGVHKHPRAMLCPGVKARAAHPLWNGSSPGSSEVRPKRGSLAMLMLGPNPVNPILFSALPRCHARLWNALISVPRTPPFNCQLVRLKDAPIPSGPMNVVGHAYSAPG
eukprot:2993236-Prymnesium_polylepis.2